MPPDLDTAFRKFIPPFGAAGNPVDITGGEPPTTYANTIRYALGEPHARRGLEIRERLLGPEHPNVAADVAALAAILDGQGKRDEAEGLIRRSLAVFERVYGPEHYEVAINLNNLAALRQGKGDDREAEQFYRRALAIKEKLLGADHPDVAMTLNNLAVLGKAQARYAEAEPLYQRALAIFETALGQSHPKTVACGENYRALLREMSSGNEPPPNNAACNRSISTSKEQRLEVFTMCSAKLSRQRGRRP